MQVGKLVHRRVTGSKGLINWLKKIKSSFDQFKTEKEEGFTLTIS